LVEAVVLNRFLFLRKQSCGPSRERWDRIASVLAPEDSRIVDLAQNFERTLEILVAQKLKRIRLLRINGRAKTDCLQTHQKQDSAAG
jgi:hypothetical protein